MACQHDLACTELESIWPQRRCVAVVFRPSLRGDGASVGLPSTRVGHVGGSSCRSCFNIPHHGQCVRVGLHKRTHPRGGSECDSTLDPLKKTATADSPQCLLFSLDAQERYNSSAACFGYAPTQQQSTSSRLHSCRNGYAPSSSSRETACCSREKVCRNGWRQKNSAQTTCSTADG